MREQPAKHYRQKTILEAFLSDDYMFAAVMANKEICKEFLAALLGWQIEDIFYFERQKTIYDARDHRSIRLDVYVKDGKGSIYNVEMQNANDRALPRRARFYQSGIDRTALGKGDRFSNLPESYVIFVCNFDLFGYGEPVYKRTQSIAGHEDFAYEDGSHVFILNSKFAENKVGNTDTRILEFLKLIRDPESITTSDFAENIKRTIHEIQTDKEQGERYMTFQQKMDELAYRTREEGRAEGLAEGRAELISRIVANKFPLETAVLLGVSEEEYRAALRDGEKK